MNDSDGRCVDGENDEREEKCEDKDACRIDLIGDLMLVSGWWTISE